MNNKLQVEAICQGTVIDHIPAGQGVKILDRLHLLNSEARITVGFNLPSKARASKTLSRSKDGCLPNRRPMNWHCSPPAHHHVIDDYRVVDKFTMAIPKTLRAAFACPNSNCITHNEPVESYFYLHQKSHDIQLKCHYCEKSFSKEIVAELR